MTSSKPEQPIDSPDTDEHRASSTPDRTGAYEPRPDGNEQVGTVIAGKYTLLELIGEGGMGAVWKARQSNPVQRLVAVKLVKGGMDSRQVIARFEAERQALAVMDHPNIAKILDGGVAETGVPYFVMELVPGESITKYCDARRLTPQKRLELFVPVCQAIQHAHQKGIIHRDIKPSNVMIALYDDRPVPKIIDFGVAKATGGQLPFETAFTGIGNIVGTPEYMSPEQASLDNLDIDTRTDIYSLGVLLYELLAGSPPFRRKELAQAGLLELLRVIREEEPPRPSTKVSAADALPSLSANRSIEPKKLTGLLRNELDWIVMKALEKDRARRYETAAGFAADIIRYLAGEPVTAHPPSKTYRLAKFLRKNQRPVFAASLVAFALIGGIVGTTWGMIQAHSAEAQTKLRADELQQVSDFQENMLRQVDPTKAGILLTDDVTAKFTDALKAAKVPDADWPAQVESFRGQWRRVNATDAALNLIDRTILKPAASAIELQFKDQPLVAAQLRQALANRYADLGLFDAAGPLQTSAMEFRRSQLGNEHPETLRSIQSQAGLFVKEGKFDQAEPLYREVLAARRHRLGEEHEDTLSAVGDLGNCLRLQRNYAEAEPLLAAALKDNRRIHGSEAKATLVALNVLGQVYADQKQFGKAEPYWREAYETGKGVFGPDDPEVLVWLNNLAALIGDKGDQPAAIPYKREALEKCRRLLGERHPVTLTAMINLGQAFDETHKLNEAEPLFREALQKQRDVLGDDHPNTMFSMSDLGAVLMAQNRLAEAEPLLREALARRRRVLGENDPDALTSISLMGDLLQAQGKLKEAEPYIRESMEKSRRILGEDDRRTLVRINALGVLYLYDGKPAQAEPFCRETLEKGRRILGPDQKDVLIWTSNMASVLRLQGKWAEAEPYFREVQQKFRRQFGAEHPNSVTTTRNLGTLLLAEGKVAEAEPYLRDALEKCLKVFGPENPNTLSTMISVGDLLVAQRKPAEAIALIAPIEAKVRAVSTGSNVSRLSSLLTILGHARVGVGEFIAAEVNLLEAWPIAVKTDPPAKKGSRDCAQAFVDLFTAWDKAEPGKGHAAKAAEWKVKLDAIKTPDGN